MAFKKQYVKSKSRKIVNSKKIVIDGIEFASTTEGYMYTLLRDNNIINYYEGKTYELMKTFVYGSECRERAMKRSKEMMDRRKVNGIKYTPDFVGEDEAWIIEVKGRPNEAFPLRWKMFKLLMQTQEKPPILYKPTNREDCLQVIKSLKELGYGKKK